eukprot:106427-Amphidinium_carterae.2
MLLIAFVIFFYLDPKMVDEWFGARQAFRNYSEQVKHRAVRAVAETMSLLYKDMMCKPTACG